MNLIFTAIVAAIPLYLVGLGIWSFAKAEGTTWQRLVAAFRGSASIAWARLNTISISLLGLIGDASGWLGAPGVQDTVAPWLSPKALLCYALAVAIGGEFARRRTLSK